jgi:glycosyltransferase involved in cell wall biosynthesis
MTEQDVPTSVDSFDPHEPFNSVSVIIPVYKGARFIRGTLDSILAQTVRPSEVLVIDDESPDDSGTIAEAFGPPVRVVKTKNGGASAARNLGASEAKSNWLAFCDQDDLWHASKLEKQLRLANDFPEVHCVLTDYTEITDGVIAGRSHFSYAPTDFWNKEDHESGFVVRKPITGKLSSFQPGITSTPIVKREFFLSSGGFDLNVEWGAEDTCFHFRCLSAVPFGVVPEILMYYNRHSDAGSADPIKQLRKTIIVWEHIVSTYPEAQPYRTELLNGVLTMRNELKESERYAKRQKLKRLLGIK